LLKIAEGILKGDRRSLSRAISIIDNEEGKYQEIIRQIFKKTGEAMTIGFTGPGGSGKSSLIGLVEEFKDLGTNSNNCSRSYKSNNQSYNSGDRIRIQAI
jgi:LAO/AO transport system kinase